MIRIFDNHNCFWGIKTSNYEITPKGNYLVEVLNTNYIDKVLIYPWLNFNKSFLHIYKFIQSNGDEFKQTHSLVYLPIVNVLGYAYKNKHLHLFMNRYESNISDISGKDAIVCLIQILFALEFLHKYCYNMDISLEHILVKNKKYYLNGLTSIQFNPTAQDKLIDIQNLLNLLMPRINLNPVIYDHFMGIFKICELDYKKICTTALTLFSYVMVCFLIICQLEK